MPASGRAWVLAFIFLEALGNLKKIWLAVMKCDDTLWLEELLGFRVEDRPFLPSCDLCDRNARTTDSPWVGIRCSQFLLPFQRHFKTNPNAFPVQGPK